MGLALLPAAAVDFYPPNRQQLGEIVHGAGTNSDPPRSLAPGDGHPAAQRAQPARRPSDTRCGEQSEAASRTTWESGGNRDACCGKLGPEPPILRVAEREIVHGWQIYTCSFMGGIFPCLFMGGRFTCLFMGGRFTPLCIVAGAPTSDASILALLDADTTINRDTLA